MITMNWLAPLEQTCEELYRAGFLIERLLEPHPVPQAEALRPEDYQRLHREPNILVAVVLRRLLVRVVDREADRHLGRIVGRFLSVVVVAVGAVFALDVVGVAIGPLLGALGVGGIALAFAAQDMLANLVSGCCCRFAIPSGSATRFAVGTTRASSTTSICEPWS